MSYTTLLKITTGFACLLTMGACTKQAAGPTASTNTSTAPASFTSLTVHGSVQVVLSPDSVNQINTQSGNVTYHYSGQTLSISGSGTANLSVKELDALTITGSATVSSQDSLRMDDLNVETHGSSTINLKLILQNKLNLLVTGDSDNYTLAGRCPKINADIKGSPQIQAYSFLTQDAHMEMNGSGNCQVFASNSLNADLKGSCILYYKGNPPTLTQALTGTAQLIAQ